MNAAIKYNPSAHFLTVMEHFWAENSWRILISHLPSFAHMENFYSFFKVVLITFFSFDIQNFFFVKVHARKDKKTEGNPLILLMMVGRNRKLIWVTCDREINPLQSQVPFSHAKTTQIRFYFWDLWNLGGLFKSEFFRGKTT